VHSLSSHSNCAPTGHKKCNCPFMQP